MRVHNGVAGATHGVLRIVVGLLFMMHGGQKLLGWVGGMGDQGGTVAIGSMPGIAGILELAGGALIIIGFLTKPVAFVLSGEMAVAYFMMHFPKGFWPIENQGEPAALYSFIFLFFAFNGAGLFSIDAWLSRRREGALPTQLRRERELPSVEVAPEPRRQRRAG
jgi:putative oxidoreductase